MQFESRTILRILFYQLIGAAISSGWSQNRDGARPEREKERLPSLAREVSRSERISIPIARFLRQRLPERRLEIQSAAIERAANPLCREEIAPLSGSFLASFAQRPKVRHARARARPALKQLSVARDKSALVISDSLALHVRELRRTPLAFCTIARSRTASRGAPRRKQETANLSRLSRVGSSSDGPRAAMRISREREICPLLPPRPLLSCFAAPSCTPPSIAVGPEG